MRFQRVRHPETGSISPLGSILALFVMAVIPVSLMAFVPPGERPVQSGNSYIAFGNDVTVDENSQADRAVSVGGSVSVLGHVRGDAVSVGGSVYLGPDSRVDGNVVAIGGTVEREPGSQVGGEVTIVDAGGLKSWVERLPSQGLASISDVWGSIGWASSLAFFLVALIITAVMPASIGSISYQIEHSTGKSVFWALLGPALIFPVGILLFVSLVGIVLIPALVILFCCALILGYVAVAQLVGKRVTIALKKPGRNILVELTIGYLALFAVGYIPLAGWVIKSAAVFLGFGGVLSALTSRRKR